ncbi:MAG: CpsD/CapB family tyrosine-protein kinase [Chloroflexota bacterium]|nr:CpsD/CapB family tyrosine-protein kinase [Chloroflexota bacterium]
MSENKDIQVTERLPIPKIPVTPRLPAPPAEYIPVAKPAPESTDVVTTPIPSVPAPPVPAVKGPADKRRPRRVSRRDAANARVLQERCRQLGVSLFFREQDPVHSLGFTSSIKGEGKSFLATLTALLLANDSHDPVTLLECNWENPTLHEYFGCPRTPGLAEWLRGECDETAIRHQVNGRLTVIPAGDGKRDAVQLLQRMRQDDLLANWTRSKDLLIVDLPSVATTAYGPLAASLVEALIVVVRAGVTPDDLIVETCAQLRDMPVHGLILNQLESRIPRWIRQLL